MFLACAHSLTAKSSGSSTCGRRRVKRKMAADEEMLPGDDTVMSTEGIDGSFCERTRSSRRLPQWSRSVSGLGPTGGGGTYRRIGTRRPINKIVTRERLVLSKKKKKERKKERKKRNYGISNIIKKQKKKKKQKIKKKLFHYSIKNNL
jgi:hypothetical protein